MDNAVDDRAKMLGDSTDDAPLGEFLRLEMNLAACSDPHRSDPLPAHLDEIRLVDLTGNSSGNASIAFPQEFELLDSGKEVVVDGLVILLGRKSNGSNDAIANRTLVPGFLPSAVCMNMGHGLRLEEIELLAELINLLGRHQCKPF